MFQVDDIWEEGRKISGNCDETKFLRWCSDAVSLTTNKAEFEGWKGYLDICSTGGKCITLHREVGTIYAVNIGGRPSLGVGQLFNFHLNGPGDCPKDCNLRWQDLGGFHAVYREITVPSKVVAYVQLPEDAGKQLIVYGKDISGNPLRRKVSGIWRDGYQVPTIHGYAIPDDEAPTIAKIDRVFKDRTSGTMRLSTIDDSGLTGTLLAVYEPDEQLPQYRRIQLNRECSWVRIAYRKANPLFVSRFDHVPLHSRIGFLCALRAIKRYSEGDLAEAHTYEADAARLELEAQNAIEPPTYSPIQVINGNNLQDVSDYDVR